MSAADGSAANPNRVSGFTYGIAFSVGLLLVITTLSLVSYWCTRRTTTPGQPARPRDPGGPSDVAGAGIDEATLMSYPKALYSEARLRDRGTTESGCSVCLADYRDTDVLRLLPDCGHMFHLECVDPWLRLHPTCPVCRTSPLPSPLSTPLAEVVPLTQS